MGSVDEERGSGNKTPCTKASNKVTDLVLGHQALKEVVVRPHIGLDVVLLHGCTEIQHIFQDCQNTQKGLKFSKQEEERKKEER